jgi:hypothetical protein
MPKSPQWSLSLRFPHRGKKQERQRTSK